MKILLLYIAELFSLAFEGSDGDKISKSLNLVFPSNHHCFIQTALLSSIAFSSEEGNKIVRRQLNMEKIKIVDAIMGAGKSTYAINMINRNSEKQYLIVLPFLSEIQRYKENISNCGIVEPRSWGMSKSTNLKELIKRGKNIITTHQLIQRIDNETLDLLEEQNYTLVLDEALNVVSKSDITKDDLKAFMNNSYIKLADDGYFEWNTGLPDAGQYKRGNNTLIKQLCERRVLRAYTDKRGKIISVVQQFPPEFFHKFTETYIFTYLWIGSMQEAYFKINDIQYEHLSLLNGVLIPYNVEVEQSIKQAIKELITVVDDEKLNSIGERRYRSNPLSSGWYHNHPELLPALKKHVYNFFRNKTAGAASDNMWSTYKDYRYELKGKGYAGSAKNVCFVPFNVKGVNDYAHKKNLAYLVNLFPEPEIKNFFHQYGATLDADNYALSCMIQWIWRSQIRNGKPITLYLPSERMRSLFYKWIS
jgi:hypothetical protein